jgi:hypothetical protein
MLSRLIENETADCISLSTNVDIEILTCSAKQTRGYTAVAVILDEVCFYRDENSSEPAEELIAALLPTMATVPSAMLLAISSPFARKGIAWERYRRFYGVPGDVLIWQAGTRTMNPTVPQRVIDRAMESDAPSARAEYLAQWRDDIASLLTSEAISACVDGGVLERPPLPGVQYYAHCDPSGGSSDSMTLALAHLGDDGIPVLDLVREVAPLGRGGRFNPRDVVEEFAATLKGYGVDRISGDAFGGEWPKALFREHGIEYVNHRLTASEGYKAFVPLVNSGRVRLLDHQRLIAQLASLERRLSPANKEIVTHPRGSHDDCANSAAMLLVRLADTVQQGDVGTVIAAGLASQPVRDALGTDAPSPLVREWHDWRSEFEPF